MHVADYVLFVLKLALVFLAFVHLERAVHCPVAAQRIEGLRVTAERTCTAGATDTGLQCHQRQGDVASSRYTTIEIDASHRLGSNETIRFQSPWTVARPRSASNEPQTSNSLTHHGFATELHSVVTATQSSGRTDRVELTVEIEEPKLAFLLSWKKKTVPGAVYFEARTGDEFLADPDNTALAPLSEILTDNVTRTEFLTNTNPSPADLCSKLIIYPNDGRQCARKLGLGDPGEYTDPKNTGATDPLVRGAYPSTLYGESEFLEPRDDCRIALCYPCDSNVGTVDKVTMIRTLPVGPLCNEYQIVEQPEFLINGRFTLSYDQTYPNGTTTQRIETQTFDSLRVGKDGRLVTNAGRTLSVRVDVQVSESLRQVQTEHKVTGYIIACGSAPYDMGASYPYNIDTAGSSTLDVGTVTSGTARVNSDSIAVPFYHLNQTGEQRTMSAGGSCTNREKHQLNCFQTEGLLRSQCSTTASLGERNLVNAGDVPNSAECLRRGSFTPMYALSEINRFHQEYNALPTADQRRALPVPEFLPPLWNMEYPNVWIHRTNADAAVSYAAATSDQYHLIYDLRHSGIAGGYLLDDTLNMTLIAHIHEGLINVIEPDEILEMVLDDPIVVSDEDTQAEPPPEPETDTGAPRPTWEQIQEAIDRARGVPDDGDILEIDEYGDPIESDDAMNQQLDDVADLTNNSSSVPAIVLDDLIEEYAGVRSAPVISTLLTSCTMAGLDLTTVGITGVDRNGKYPKSLEFVAPPGGYSNNGSTRDPHTLEENLAWIAFSMDICNVRRRPVRYTVESRCVSPLIQQTNQLLFDSNRKSAYHREEITINRTKSRSVPPSCYRYTAPLVPIARSVIADAASTVDTTLAEFTTVGYCDVVITNADQTIVYEAEFDYELQDGNTRPRNTSRNYCQPERVNVTYNGVPETRWSRPVRTCCTVQTKPMDTADIDQVADGAEEATRGAMWGVLIGIGLLLLIILVITVFVCCVYHLQHTPSELDNMIAPDDQSFGADLGYPAPTEPVAPPPEVLAEPSLVVTIADGIIKVFA